MSIDIPQEHDAVDRPRLLVIAGGALAIAVVAVIVAAILLRAWAGGRAESASSRIQRPTTLESTLVESNERGRAEREEQRRALDSWRWVDRDAGVVQIPIDVAMDLVTEEARQ